ncbi:hypothetical protein DH2020_029882 [Rehmannia glutinosa]|uniref:WRKY domain-containing protein n=1 Tax=Rehmannia glutinosa TaxID=99300 RepID=A0ABR0VQW3_REHGL
MWLTRALSSGYNIIQLWRRATTIRQERTWVFGDDDDLKPIDELDQNQVAIDNDMKKGMSIAERRAANGDIAAPQPQSPYVTIPPGISSSELLDSLIMLPNAQAQLSPTTGTFQFPSPNHEESLNLNLKLDSKGDNTTAMESSSKPEAQEPFEDFEYPNDMGFEETQPATNTEVMGNQMYNQINDQMSVREITNQDQKHHQKVAYIPKEGMAKNSEDGFFWRKYGQKHVKGSEYPRSYYKCTNTNCLAKKKVERSQDGEIAEIVYDGVHNHPVPQPFKRLNEMSDTSDVGGTSIQAGNFSSDWRPDGLDGTSDFPPVTMFEPVEGTQDFSCAFGSQLDGDDQKVASPESISLNVEDEVDNGDCEPKRRKRENLPNETTIPRSTREPKVVVQIESNVDILDDGYRWRKYGQKVVKGNPNPRSYYKCTTPGCPVRKHVERAANDIKFVITTYEGKHNHEVPTSKTSSSMVNISDNVANHHPTVTNNNSVSTQKPPDTRVGNQVHDLPLYMDTKSIWNYNDFMRLPARNFSNHDINFGAHVYPISFPSLPSHLSYNPLLMNVNNNNNTYPSAKLYPDCMPLPLSSSSSSQINHVPAVGSSSHVRNFPFNNYATIQNPSQGLDIRECQNANITKPKEEQMEEDELYDTCLSLPNHGNGTI